jgi:hypothetical protein
MKRFDSPLDRVKVASPCNVDWDQMIGNERVRFCGNCSLNVYNLSSLSRQQAESLIAGHEGRLCIRYYQRFDGSIITSDCPIGLQAVRHRLSQVKRAVVSVVLTFLAGVGFTRLVAPQISMGVVALKVSIPTRRDSDVSEY